MIKRTLAIVGCLLIFFGCASTPPPAPPPEESANQDQETVINNLFNQYVEGINARDLGLLLDMMVDDGVYLSRIDEVNRPVTKAEYERYSKEKFKHWDRIGLSAKSLAQWIDVDNAIDDLARGGMVMEYSGPGWKFRDFYRMYFEYRNGGWKIIQIRDL
jgi:hypothetical protein